jgi:Ser/Thr protein kinase RdoA (MazF antagonist)
MSKGGAHFSSQELARVLSHFDIGIISDVKPLIGGNLRAPKLVIISDQGKFLLKRRSRGKDDLYRVAFAHSLQQHLAGRGFPLASLVSTSDEKNTILQLDHHIYECFKFITAVRYDGSAEATTDAGRQLANFHKYSADFACEWKPLRGSFHDSHIVRRHLKMIGAEKTAWADRKLSQLGSTFLELYNFASVHVSQLGFDKWPQQVVHGDWHPGNMLFDRSKLVAVLDFDSVKLAPTATDIANGMLQFSIVGNRPNPADWPDYLDQAKLIQFLNGYREVIDLDSNILDSLIELMLETIIAEAVLPVATTGFFGNLSGFDFLQMILRKANWIHNNRQTLARAIES